MNNIHPAIKALLPFVKEVVEEKNTGKAAMMIQCGKWFIINAAINGAEITWVLARTTD